MSFLSRIPKSYRTVFLTSFALALLFAVFTNHVWEDYYITYRSSKNLATGHGLVFNHGDRLHTFTSPLGVLLPALASVLTLNRSDTVALWLFRIISSAAFAGGITLAYATLLHLHRNVVLAGLAAAWLALDAKSLDFTINGMETGVLLFFISLTLWAHFGACPRRWLWLGLGWAGLMWTRPDGFLYIGLLALGSWLFNDAGLTGLTRRQWFKTFALAGLLCTAVYLPWFVGSWIYYGTPVPHTITAKATMMQATKSALGAIEMAVSLPLKVWKGESSLPDTFLPSYYMMGGWPGVFAPLARCLAFVAAFAWLIPVFSRPTRAVSFAFFGLHVYLSYYPYFPFPWYLPGTTLLGYFVIAGVLARLAGAESRTAATAAIPAAARLPWLALVPAIALVGFNVWATTGAAGQLAAQQRWIEDGNRRKIGEWLKEQASPSDRVFLEPLGYIGYFSGLKTYDFPGMSSREMVEAVKRLGGDWALLLDYLGPEWIVLRPKEAERVHRSYPMLLTATYHHVRDFDVLGEVKKLSVAGRPYLEFDSYFQVFRRERPRRFVTELGEFRTPFDVSVSTIENRQMQLVHAPGTWIVKVPAEARHVRIAYAYPTAAYEADPKTDGARFTIRLVDGTREHVLHSRVLDPAIRVEDRGVQKVELELPRHAPGARLQLTTNSGATTTKDWTSWASPEFW